MNNKIWIGVAIGALCGAFVTANNRKVHDSVCKCSENVKDKLESSLNDGEKIM